MFKRLLCLATDPPEADSTMNPSREILVAAAQSFCDAFSQKQDIPILLSYFSTTHQVFAIEHGESRLAPFLGRKFTELSGVQEYFEIIGSLLSYEKVAFSEFVVDTDRNCVALKGKGRFTWLSTENSWDEIFAYMLSFDDELKVVEYQVWADSGAAYLARLGQLDKVRKPYYVQI